jgi:glycosyltransferase involved in cell wall biosynthesis
MTAEPPAAKPAPALALSIVIKALNEERNIERTLRSAVAAAQGLAAEVIVADSLSSDRTVEIARQFPVVVVQLQHGAERCCGIGAQLGYQHALGRYVLVLDGDMEVEAGWLRAAMDRLDAEPRLAGVGGLVEDVNLDNIEFRARQQRRPPDMRPGTVDRLDMGGLYRREAIESVDYLTHRSLHACEELELGLRLGAAGWRLERLDRASIHHYGHTVDTWTLVRRRWRSRYVNGAGELLRASLGQPWFWRAVASLKLRIVVLGWWLTMLLLVLVAIAGVDRRAWLVALIVALLPPTVMVWRKRSVAMGLYSVFSWCVDAAGLLRGLFARTADPRSPIASRVLHGRGART